MLPGCRHQRQMQHPGLDPIKPSVLVPAGRGPLLVATRDALGLSQVCRQLPRMLSASTSSQSLSSQDWVLAMCLAQLQLLELSPGTSHARVWTEQTACRLRQCPDLLRTLALGLQTGLGASLEVSLALPCHLQNAGEVLSRRPAPPLGSPCWGGPSPRLTSPQHLELLEAARRCSSNSGTHIDTLLLAGLLLWFASNRRSRQWGQQGG